MAKPTLGERLEQWFRNLPVVGNLAANQIDYQRRREATDQAIMDAVVASFKAGKIGKGLALFVIGGWKQLVGGADVPLDDLTVEDNEIQRLAQEIGKNPSAWLGSQLEQLTSSPAIREVAESVGALVMDPVIGLFESYANKPDLDPHEFSRAFHGYMMSLSWAGSAVEAP
jgi:hypothetical protein